MVMKNAKKKNQKIPYLLLLMLCCCITVSAQKGVMVKGVVVDAKNEPVIGASIVLKGNNSIGTISDIDGNFVLTVPNEKSVLVVSYIGMKTKEVQSGKGTLKVTLEDDSRQLEEVVVVGYGQQKKASVIGAITQTSGKTLERAGGVSSVGAALTGNLPGVITTATQGTPGAEDPKIYIRGQSTWNNSDPLVLVDGIERPMSSVDISSIENISVLKDASATAVFGVKGANGVILITTKRGQEGKADIRIAANATVKIPSKLASKYDSYDALALRNEAIIRELGLYPESWDSYTPQDILDKYRNPKDVTEAERYPNVDWADEMIKKATMSYNANVSASGGNKFVKYFASVDYLHEGDILKKIENNKSYDPGYGFNRINVRSNLDFNLTKSTVLTANLSGSYGVKQDAWGQDEWEYRIWQSIYSNPPDCYLPRYSDGTWGYYPPDQVATVNSAATLGNNGVRKITTGRINTDFTLKQDLGMLLKGLSARVTLSFDNVFKTQGGVYDDGNVLFKYIDPNTGQVTLSRHYGTNQFDYIMKPWSVRSDETFLNKWGGNENSRKLYYQAQVDYARKFGNHDVTLMGLFSRDKYATGSEFEHYREDWVFRGTYNYASRYFVEFNGAYNGSEKFGPQNRFAFFPSAGIGWMISEEKFMKSLKFLDMLKVRATYGQVGDDNISERWLYVTQWKNAGTSGLGSHDGNTSPYTWWKEDKIGNPDIHWEKVTKKNIGVEFSFFNGWLAGSFEAFNDYRTDILLEGSKRAIPVYFGGTPGVANLGKVRVKGYELELRSSKVFENGMRIWGNFSMTHAKDKVVEADDPVLKDEYQRQANKQIGQTYAHISNGYYNTWDELYASTILNTYDSEKLPGNLNFVDYNGDGVIDTYDSVPYGYPERPQNTYSATVGFEWKGFSAFVQFYGVNNCNRSVDLNSFSNHLNRAYKLGTYWSADNTGADAPMPRWNSHAENKGTINLYDSSYIRLKNVELAYTFTQEWVKKIGIKSLRLYVNGDNLWMWSHMPDDREVNLGASSAYPTVRRVNIGFNVNL